MVYQLFQISETRNRVLYTATMKISDDDFQNVITPLLIDWLQDTGFLSTDPDAIYAVNFDKTHVVWIGINKYSTKAIKTRWKLSWGKTDFKLLGITFHIDLDKIERINYTEKIYKINSLITLWKRRILTPLGKITVIKPCFCRY